MSKDETPLTDAEIIHTTGGDIVYADFAITLERDRADLIKTLSALLTAWYDSRDLTVLVVSASVLLERLK